MVERTTSSSPTIDQTTGKSTSCLTHQQRWSYNDSKPNLPARAYRPQLLLTAAASLIPMTFVASARNRDLYTSSSPHHHQSNGNVESLIKGAKEPNDARNHTELLKTNQRRSAKYYNKSARDLFLLAKGYVVRLKPFQLWVKEWKKGNVIQRLDERWGR